MDHVVTDPRGYWAHTGEAELIARIAVSGERARWLAVLAKHLPPETCTLMTQEVLKTTTVIQSPFHRGGQP